MFFNAEAGIAAPGGAIDFRGVGVVSGICTESESSRSPGNAPALTDSADHHVPRGV